jgi:colanic acid/amylovoran biosynthesis glycosyltransferase
MKSSFLVYADPLLPRSYNFIFQQSQALNEFVPIFTGPRALGRNGIKMPANRTITVSSMSGLLGKAREVPFRRFGIAPLFFHKIEKFNPVLVHAHMGSAGLAALRISKRLAIPQVTTFHGFDATVADPCAVDPRFGNRDYVRRKKTLMEEGRLFIAISSFVKDRLVAQGFPESKVLVHYIGVDTEFFHPDEGTAREPMVLFVGSLHEVKGCEYVIKAMAKVQCHSPETELVIIGEGPLRSRLEELAKKELNRYRFLGFQAPEVVRHWMNRAKVFAVPSVKAQSGATEGFGLVFAEAQAMGLPIVSFKSGGIPEAVEHEGTGLLAKERDWGMLADYISALLSDQSLWNRMNAAGPYRVKSLFDLSTQAQKLEDIYREMLAHS